MMQKKAAELKVHMTIAPSIVFATTSRSMKPTSEALWRSNGTRTHRQKKNPTADALRSSRQSCVRERDG